MKGDEEMFFSISPKKDINPNKLNNTNMHKTL
jgi:hypothetical protein